MAPNFTAHTTCWGYLRQVNIPSIVFSEKINVSSAQKGFFIAKSFTKDAVAQAQKNTRIQLLTVADVPTENLPLPFGFHYLTRESANIELAFKARRAEQSNEPAKHTPITAAELRGETVDIQTLAATWSAAIWEERSNKFRSERLPDGIYPLTSDGEMLFASGELLADGCEIERVVYKCQFTARVVRPAIISYFNVESRGRSMQLAPVELGDGNSVSVRLTQHRQ